MDSAKRLLPAVVLAIVLLWIVGYPLLMTALEALGLPGEVTRPKLRRVQQAQ